jgi:hypothetical protein
MAQRMSEMDMNEPVEFNTNYYSDPDAEKVQRKKKK